ncbi:galactosyltransferase-related protein [Synechococcus sp. UW140]|uniref:galactosyltransferase-related protein n=1 Tax=Synechococcus sp. UW140 TaxID=368503 RepID=UPI0025D257D9|nr:galactosyltransferase-related protein [Synechococcus sp. UW140]
MNQSSSVSVITVSHNRTSHLIISALAISKWNIHFEHIIVDWNSNPPILTSDLPIDPRIRLVRVENQGQWWLAKAYNQAARCASGEWLLKVDADCILDQAFFDAFDPRKASIQTFGNLSGSTNSNVNFNAWGLFSVKRDVFEQCGGFNEWLFGWGFDDTDLYERILEVPNTTLALLPKCGVHMLHHDNMSRFGANYPNKYYLWAGWLLEAQRQGNIYIACCSREAWNKIGPERFEQMSQNDVLPSTTWLRIKRQRMLRSLLIQPMQKVVAAISLLMPDYLIRMILKMVGLLDWPHCSTLPPHGEEGVRILGHRRYVGGLWKQMGTLQFEFLIEQGLKPNHRLLDIGCGSLRLGSHLIPYLQPGNYIGIEKEQSLLDAGLLYELPDRLLEDRKPLLIQSSNFEFELMQCYVDMAIANSLFTHLPAEYILICLKRLRPWLKQGACLYASFFEVSHEYENPIYPHDHGFFAYTKAQMLNFGIEAGLTAHYIGNWDHPRGQKMMVFRQVSAHPALN